ncbi:MAG: hypothetical protein QXD05_02335 [Candidatus Pacearchaeota archaeon]
MKGIPEDFINFNKEIFFGEVGAFLGVQITGNLVNYFFVSSDLVPLFVLGGSILGASLLWLSVRFYDKTKQLKKKFSEKDFLRDIYYFTPAAFILTLIIYYPSLYYLTKKLISKDGIIIFPLFFSQLGAFILLLISLNLYKFILFKISGKKL